eukprot:1161733-Pelagomonas_calceolata.AAC.4
MQFTDHLQRIACFIVCGLVREQVSAPHHETLLDGEMVVDVDPSTGIKMRRCGLGMRWIDIDGSPSLAYTLLTLGGLALPGIWDAAHAQHSHAAHAQQAGRPLPRCHFRIIETLLLAVTWHLSMPGVSQVARHGLHTSPGCSSPVCPL